MPTRRRPEWSDNVDPILPSRGKRYAIAPVPRDASAPSRPTRPLPVVVTPTNSTTSERLPLPSSLSSSASTSPSSSSASPSASVEVARSAASIPPSPVATPHSQHDPAPTSSTPQPPEWCDCGYCEQPDASVEEPVCCMSVVAPDHRDPDGDVCQRAEILHLLTAGPTREEYEQERWRFKNVRPADDSYNGCSPPQRRLILYGLLHKLLYPRGVKGQRDAMPECLKAAVRRACTRPACPPTP